MKMENALKGAGLSMAELARRIRFQQHPTMTACWIWEGAMDRGQPRYNSGSARQVVYQLVRHASAPERLSARCGQGTCVNPHHMGDR